jgi:hypothetical protein
MVDSREVLAINSELYKPKRPPLPGAVKLVLLAGIELATY